MTVLMPNASATIRRRVEGALNAHGERTSAGLSARATPLLPALIEQRSDGGWSASLDPALWPVRKNDVIDDHGGRTFVVITSDLLENVFEPMVNHVLCEVQNVTADGTEPVDPWFVARTAVTPTPDPGGGGDDEADMFTGHGPPPPDLLAGPGDMYLDLDSGVLYEYRSTPTGHGPPPPDLLAGPGDMYLDLDTGVLYEYEETP